MLTFELTYHISPTIYCVVKMSSKIIEHSVLSYTFNLREMELISLKYFK